MGGAKFHVPNVPKYCSLRYDPLVAQHVVVPPPLVSPGNTLPLLHSCSVKLLSSDVIGLTICPPLKNVYVFLVTAEMDVDDGTKSAV